MIAEAERGKTIDAVRWAIVIVAFLTVWQCAKALNANLHTQGLVHTDAIAAQVRNVVAGGAEGGPGFLGRISNALSANSGAIAAGLFLFTVCALVIRMFFAAAALDSLYSPERTGERRTMVGFLVRVLGLFLLLALVYVMSAFVSPDLAKTHSGVVPLLMVLFLLGCAVWDLAARLLAIEDKDKRLLRGLWFSCGFNVIGAVGVALLLWFATAADKAHVHAFHTANPSRNIILAATGGILVCALEVFFLGAIYRKTEKPGLVKTIVTAVVLLLIVGFCCYLLSIPAPGAAAAAAKT